MLAVGGCFVWDLYYLCLYRVVWWKSPVVYMNISALPFIVLASNLLGGRPLDGPAHFLGRMFLGTIFLDGVSRTHFLGRAPPTSPVFLAGGFLGTIFLDESLKPPLVGSLYVIIYI